MNQNLRLDCSLTKSPRGKSLFRAQNINEAAFDSWKVAHPKGCGNICLFGIKETKRIINRRKQSLFLLFTFN